VTDMGGGSSAELLISEAVVCCFESVTDVGGSSCAALVSESCLGQWCIVLSVCVGGSISADLLHSWVFHGAVTYCLLCVCLWQMHVHHHRCYCYCLGKWYRSPLPQWAVDSDVLLCVCVCWHVSGGSSAELFSASLCHLEHWCIVV